MKDGKMMATLVHLSTNMWFEAGNTRGMWWTDDKGVKHQHTTTFRAPGEPTMRLDRQVWREYMDELREAGNNTIMIDLGDGVVYDTHPEIALKDAWTKKELTDEIARLKAMGFKLIPKLNFSATHDYWMGEYAKMVGSKIYYKVCADLIAEVCEMFEPEYFHIGMDEEDYEMQKDYDYITIRCGDTWWNDVKFLAAEVEKHGARAIMWSDYARHYCDEFIEKCPKSIVQAVWYYHNKFYGELEDFIVCRVEPFKRLADAGFDILPSGSTCITPENLPNLVKYSLETIPENQIVGFCQTVWEAVVPKYKNKLTEGNEAVKEAIKAYNEN